MILSVSFTSNILINSLKITTNTCIKSYIGTDCLLNIHLKQTDCNIKIKTIKYIAQENGYDLQLIETLIKIYNIRNSKLTYKKLQLITTKICISNTL